MAPTNPSEEARSDTRQGHTSNRNHRRRDPFCDRQLNRRDENGPSQDFSNARDIASSAYESSDNRTVRNHRDKGGGRGNGAKRKENNHKNFKKDAKTAVETSKRDRVYSECSDDHCAVCLNRMTIYAVGMCNHPVCSECSTRMRILCAQNECPICRQDMPKVIHTLSRKKYEDIQNNIYIMDRKYKICFENEAVEQSYKDLLEHVCKICKEQLCDVDNHNRNGSSKVKSRSIFPSFKQLESHVRREHEMFYCDLCAEHLKIFSCERKLYSRVDLATHRRKGDENDSSQKGHPLCEFCQLRYVDSEVLYRHLRKDHYFCHFCDADGKQIYFDAYENGLKKHFKEEHFLCEEGNCKSEQFTSAFREEIDFKAHMSERHSGNLSKAAAKQIRTVDVDFNYTRPGTNSQVGRRRGRDFEESVPSFGVGVSVVPAVVGNPSSLIDQVDGAIGSKNSYKAPVMTNENFPSLGGKKSSANSISNLPGSLKMQPNSCGNGGFSGSSSANWARSGGLTAPRILNEHFPTLSENKPISSSLSASYGIPKKKDTPQKVSPKSSSSADPFPTLCNPAISSRNLWVEPSMNTYGNAGRNQLAWGQSKDNIPEKVKSSSGNSNSISGMITLSKKGIRNPPAITSQIYDLANSKNIAPKNKNDTKQKCKLIGAESNKKNRHKNGHIIGENVPSISASRTNGTAVKKSSNLSSAADLISLAPQDTPTSLTKQKEIDNEKDIKKDYKNKGNLNESINTPNDKGAKSKSSKDALSKATNHADNFPSLKPAASKISANFAKNDKITTNTKGPWKLETNNHRLSVENSNSVPEGPNISPLPPPGFDDLKTKNRSEATSMPPGFEPSALKSTNFVYTPPKDFASRNRKLLSLITELMGGTESARFSKFKTVSSQFRRGDITCDTYHGKCLELLDKESFELFFPELLCLLPDIDKQGKLLSIHRNMYRNSILMLHSCPECDQIVSAMEANDHSEHHLRYKS